MNVTCKEMISVVTCGETEKIEKLFKLRISEIDRQDLRKHAIYSVLKVGDRIPMIIAITQCACVSPDYAEILNNMLAIEKMGAIDPDSPFFWLNSPATPDPDWLIATEMAKSFDGVVMDDPCGSCQLRYFYAQLQLILAQMKL
ncbi:hypothetical protein L2E71_21985 [Planktothrix agardhii 1032]|uniref:hypothetical protein n=1 Tax=Planktothrix agardhii TaxID=1160 RepID=UPI001F1D034C|nr:hypothetical protein [Planktothrix agardhii]MCF3600738.1 hypothetical protein [Planktothrix agardhii 1032]